MKKFIVSLIILMALLSSLGYAFDFWSLFRSTTGLSTAIMVSNSVNSYQFEVGDTLLLPSGKQVEVLDVRSDNSVEVSASGSIKRIKLNDYEILNDVKVFYLSKLASNKVQLTIDDFSSADSAKQLSDLSYIFVTGSKLVQNGMAIYLSSVGGDTIKFYIDGRKDALRKGESKNLKQLKITFLGSSLTTKGLTAVKLNVEKAKCIDSDNGEQVFTKGNTIDAFGDVSFDACVTVTDGVEAASNGCYGPDCYVKEGYCDSRYPDYKIVKTVRCKAGCLAGVCEEEKATSNTPDAKDTGSGSTAKMSALYVIENSIEKITVAWNGEDEKYNLYLNKDDTEWENPIKVSTNSYTLKKLVPNVRYGFYVAALDSYNREGLPSSVVYVTAKSTNGKCTDSDGLETGKQGYVKIGDDLIYDTCLGTKLVEGYCMQDGTYAIKVFEQKGLTCESGRLKAKPSSDCQASGCRSGYSCIMTNAVMESFECIKSPEETQVKQSKDQTIRSLEEEITQLKARVKFLEAELAKR